MEPIETNEGTEYGLLDVVEKFGEAFDFEKEKEAFQYSFCMQSLSESEIKLPKNQTLLEFLKAHREERIDKFFIEGIINNLSNAIIKRKKKRDSKKQTLNFY